MSVQVPKGYKQTEVGVIPEDWVIRPLLSAVRIASGQVDPKNEPYRSMVLVAPDHIESSSGRLLKKVSAFEQHAISGKYLFKSGDIVYSKIRPYLKKAILADFDGLCSADMYPLQPNNGFSAGFLFASILGCRFSKYAESVSVRSGMPKINRSELADYSMAFPPRQEEQERIAEALSDADALIESLEQLIAKKRQIKQGAMQELLTGQRRLPGFSGAWNPVTLGQLGKCLRGVSYKGSADLFDHDNDRSKRLLRSNNVQSSSIDEADIQFVNANCVSNDQILKNNDILICMANGSKDLVGKSALFNLDDGFEYTFGAFMGCLRLFSNLAESKFLSYLMQTSSYRDQINNLLAGSSINNLTPTSIESLEFLVPSKDEQVAISLIIGEMDKEIESLNGRLMQSRKIKQSMMQELLTGRIRLI